MFIFEWDSRKAERNLRKHGVPFVEAATVFSDVQSIIFFDPDHSLDEDRYIAIGFSAEGRLLMVAFTERDETIRIISSRSATRAEESYYHEQTG